MVPDTPYPTSSSADRSRCARPRTACSSSAGPVSSPPTTSSSTQNPSASSFGCPGSLEIGSNLLFFSNPSLAPAPASGFSVKGIGGLPLEVTSSIEGGKHRHQLTMGATVLADQEQAATRPRWLVPDQIVNPKHIRFDIFSDSDLGSWKAHRCLSTYLLGATQIFAFGRNVAHFSRYRNLSSFHFSRVFEPMPKVVLVTIPGFRTGRHARHILQGT